MKTPFEQMPVVSTQTLKLGGKKIDILRLDSIHPEISGNKWFKLKYNVLEAKESGINRILTFGGAYSNHIAAVAAAGHASRVSTIGIIRGEDTAEDNPTLRRAVEHGMELHFISREDYRKRGEEHFIEYMHSLHGRFHLVPEGGSNALGVKGASEIPSLFKKNYDYVACAVGSGGTLAGLIQSNSETLFAGFPVLKGADYLGSEVARLSSSINSQWELNHDYHFGGYAKSNEQLIQFIQWFHANYAIKLDPIYTAKLLFGINDLITSRKLDEYGSILVLHTGGLQGVEGFEEVRGIRLFN